MVQGNVERATEPGSAPRAPAAIRTVGELPGPAGLPFLGDALQVRPERFLGSVPDKIALHAPCSVLIVQTA